MLNLRILMVKIPLRPVMITAMVAIAIAIAIIFSPPAPGPALWKVEGGQAELYLLGTFHLLPSELTWKNKPIVSAMAASQTLVLEADTSNEAEIGALIQKYAFNPEGKTLRSYFTDEEAERVDTALRPWGMSVDGAARLKPWFVSLQVGLTAMFSLGYDPESGVEQALLSVAAENTMSLDYLETGEAGIRALADHPDRVQANILLASIDDLARIEEMMDQMIDAWSQGDIATVAQILNASMMRTPALSETVLYQRNRNWISPLETMLKSEGTYFVAVGAGHMAGRNSIIELLEARGYQLIRQ